MTTDDTTLSNPNFFNTSTKDSDSAPRAPGPRLYDEGSAGEPPEPHTTADRDKGRHS